MNWSFLILSYLCLASVGFVDTGRGALYHEILSSLKLSSSVGSQIFALASLASLLALLSSKWWIRRFNLLHMQRVFLLIQAVGCFGFGYAGYLESPVFTLLTSSFIFGASLGGTSITCNLLIARGAPQIHHRRAYSGLHSMYGIASFLSPLIISMMRASNVNWMDCFIIFSFFPLTVSILSFIPKRRITAVKEDSSIALGLRFKIQIALIFALYVASEIAISSRLVFYLSSYENIPDNLARSYLSVFFALLLLGRVSFGAFRFPYANSSLLKVSLSCSLLFSLIGLFIHPMGLALCGLSMSFFFPCGMSWINEQAKEKSEQLLSWVMTFIGIMIIIMHWIIGGVSEVLNIHYGLMIIPIFLFFSLLLIWKRK